MPRLLTPVPASIAALTAALALTDLGSWLGEDSLVGGVCDEIAHECTGVLVLWAFGRRASLGVFIGVVVASIAIDLDHVPALLGFDGVTAGTPRPYTHSLVTIAVLSVALLVVRHRRDLLVGAVLGIAVHLWRDLGEPGTAVSLLWPFSYRPFSISHAIYLATMAAVVALNSRRCWSASQTRRVR